MSESEDKLISASDETADSAAADSAATPKPSTAGAAPPHRRSRAFRQELLSRLPFLGHPKWEPAEAMNVYQDLQGIVDVDADAFLKPLEAIVEERHE